ncbi:MAG: hypothetical protein EZS28_005038 [Streblomastix strix]|uniref:Uncharacterized protein n=1 Tax=Streblomastix strix TaxID=222440 RepID=A0A5J4WX31_9EUKA|nr:MAG: hypothetical protein EZS28_005038 [Streblomastix strix]
MEFPQIHPSTFFLPAILKKIRDELMSAMIVAPLWPGVIWCTELFNWNVQYFLHGWSNEILEPGNIVHQEEFETISTQDRLFSDGQQAGKG